MFSFFSWHCHSLDIINVDFCVEFFMFFLVILVTSSLTQLPEPYRLQIINSWCTFIFLIFHFPIDLSLFAFLWHCLGSQRTLFVANIPLFVLSLYMTDYFNSFYTFSKTFEWPFFGGGYQYFFASLEGRQKIALDEDGLDSLQFANTKEF